MSNRVTSNSRDTESRLFFTADLPDGHTVPVEFQLFPRGEIEIEGAGSFTVDEAGMERAVRRFDERGLDMVIDYEHQTEGGSQAPAAGWIKRIENRGSEGLWAIAEWTERARRYLENREYRYFSPVFLISAGERKLSELLRVALTNAPRLNRIRPIVAKTGGDAAAEEGDNRIVSPSTHPGMETKEKQMDFLEIVAKQLGLSETASPEEVAGAVEELLSRRSATEAIACKEVLNALDLAEGAGKSEVAAAIHVLKQRPDLTLVVAGLKEQLFARDRTELVAAAVHEGKITPAQREWAEKYAKEDADGFRLFVAKAPRIVPLDAIRPAGDRPGNSGGPDDNQVRINRLMGIDELTWGKYN